MTLKNNRAPLLSYFKLCGSFHTHWWIQTGVTVRKRPIWVKIDDLFSRVTFKLDRWPWKTKEHLFYATSTFVHYFVAIGEFKLELQSGNAQFGSKSTIFLAVWPSNLMDDLEQGKSEGFESCDRRPAFSLETPNLGQNPWCFVPRDLEIWWMTLEKNKASLLCCFKLCAIFHSHWWIQAGVTVRKRPMRVKFDDF